jgi:transcription-repair coupling factor (superfamily II helicase)
MDRLLCGDVGFGKTEIAMRAAFRVATAGGTGRGARADDRARAPAPPDVPGAPGRLPGDDRRALAHDHRQGGARRARARRAGQVDILIGTHRLLSKDVHFKNLGLLVVDEEQRFGVVQKEHFKALRADVDVLTLSATPIPRTLHMSLSGLRDISALGTPPPGRQAIETRVVDAEDRKLLREAISPRRTAAARCSSCTIACRTSTRSRALLQTLVPECSFAIGHGQMRSKELETIVDSFARGEIDVLVATTIVENGSTSPPRARSSSTRRTSTASPSCTSCAVASDADSSRRSASCSSSATSRSPRSRANGSRRWRSSTSSAPGSRSA